MFNIFWYFHFLFIYYFILILDKVLEILRMVVWWWEDRRWWWERRGEVSIGGDGNCVWGFVGNVFVAFEIACSLSWFWVQRRNVDLSVCLPVGSCYFCCHLADHSNLQNVFGHWGPLLQFATPSHTQIQFFFLFQLSPLAKVCLP